MFGQSFHLTSDLSGARKRIRRRRDRAGAYLSDLLWLKLNSVSGNEISQTSLLLTTKLSCGRQQLAEARDAIFIHDWYGPLKYETIVLPTFQVNGCVKFVHIHMRYQCVSACTYYLRMQALEPLPNGLRPLIRQHPEFLIVCERSRVGNNKAL